MTDFQPSDKVRSIHTGDEYAVCFGPYNATFGPAYVVQDAEGTGMVIRAEVLEPIQPADPRVDVAAIALFGRATGYLSTDWDVQTEGTKDSFREDVRAILAALDAMPKDEKLNIADSFAPPAPRRVRDCDGDVWDLRTDGRWTSDDNPYASFITRDQLAAAYGPLTEI